MNTMITSGGSARNRSTMKTISRLTGRQPRLRSSASASPAARPLAMTSAASSTVTSVPYAMSGKYLAMTFALKKVSRKRSRLEGDKIAPESVALDLADEGARALVARRLEDRGGRAPPPNGPLRPEEPPGGGGARAGPLVAHPHHRHGALP